MSVAMLANGRSQRRNSFDIVSEILTTCQKEQSKTSVVYKCNLNFKLISGYLQTLLTNGLLEEVRQEDRILYKCTEKGSVACREMNHTREIISFMYPNWE